MLKNIIKTDNVAITFTVCKHAWRGELNIRQGSQVVEDSTAVTLPLGIIHKGPDVVLLTVVTNPRTDYHGNVIWHPHKDTKESGCATTFKLES